MSCPSSRILPVIRELSIRSFIRLRSRNSVLLPQPLGPMNAATDRSGIVSEISNSACLAPYQKFTWRTANFASAAGSGVSSDGETGRVRTASESMITVSAPCADRELHQHLYPLSVKKLRSRRDETKSQVSA